MRTLFVSDLDGTLLPKGEDDLPAPLLAELCRQRERGAYITLATGRAYASFQNVVESLGITLPVICANGASRFNPITHTLLERTVLPIETIERIFDVFLNDSRVRIYGDDEHGLWTLTDASYLNGAPPVPITKNPHRMVALQNSMRVTMGENISHKLALVMDPVNNSTIRGIIEHLNIPDVLIQSALPHIIDVIPGSCSKGLALEKLASELDVPMSQTIAFGDGENDIPMLRCAGRALTIESAPEAVKLAADTILPDNPSKKADMLREILG